MKLPVVALCFCALMPVAHADIWLCVGDNGRQSIQYKPCGKGLREKSRIVDGQRRSTAPASRSVTAGKPPIEIGLKRNKGVICQLLNTEKAEALAQIGGQSAAPPGENPKDNLLKIEKQRTRVGCDAA